ncbi:MAG: DUF4474 domain-containing protein [Lachnospiraceae bacterium]|nr:DUF4474 domain-containing protein [Lachnospiraceae bacterium]
MYLFFGILFALCIFFYIIHYCRKRRIIKRICSMDFPEKCCLLNELSRPFGFEYLPDQDIFTSVSNAWQREFGYRTSFDRTAPHLNIVFDCEPIYFDYGGQTWLIEFWKGQYGINAGGEIGIYHADALLSPEQYETAHFHCVSDDQLLPMRMELFSNNESLFSIERFHWWLTGFRMGEYREPSDLEMQITLAFPNRDMLQSFWEGLRGAGYTKIQACTCNLTLSLTFSIPHTLQTGFFHRLFCRTAQWRNRLLCRLFRWITRPFSCTADRMLYLYYFLPFAFRRMVNFRKCRRPKARRRS